MSIDLKSLSKSVSGGPPKSFAYASRPPESTSSGSFTNLKLTAEKLMKEQASVKTNLQMENTKLKKLMEHIRALEEKLQNAFNENAKFKVKQKEDEKLWKGLESKFSSIKTLCDQLTKTLQLLAGQVQDSEKDKESFQVKLSANAVALDGLSQQMNDLSIKLELAEETIRNLRRPKGILTEKTAYQLSVDEAVNNHNSVIALKTETIDLQGFVPYTDLEFCSAAIASERGQKLLLGFDFNVRWIKAREVLREKCKQWSEVEVLVCRVHRAGVSTVLFLSN